MRYFRVLGWYVEGGNTHFDLALYEGYDADQIHLGDVRVVLTGERDYSGEDWNELHSILLNEGLLNLGASISGWEVPIDTTPPIRKQMPEEYTTTIAILG